LLFDDVLSALDVHTARWVAEKCLAGPLLKGRTVLLVTHNILLAGPLASFVISLGLDGRVTSTGTVQDVLKSNALLRAETKKEADTEKQAEAGVMKQGEVEGENAKIESEVSGKLVVEEEMEEGHVSWKSCERFCPRWRVFHTPLNRKGNFTSRLWVHLHSGQL
jgi:ABC-type glutathione transport system ATPase component